MMIGSHLIYGDGRMIEWLVPERLWPPHKVTHPQKVAMLAEQFKLDGGWGVGFEALVGYTTFDSKNNKWGIQLLSGSHRWAAALETGIRVPIVLLTDETVEKAWGNLPMWTTLMGMGKAHAHREGL